MGLDLQNTSPKEKGRVSEASRSEGQSLSLPPHQNDELVLSEFFFREVGLRDGVQLNADFCEPFLQRLSGLREEGAERGKPV